MDKHVTGEGKTSVVDKRQEKTGHRPFSCRVNESQMKLQCMERYRHGGIFSDTEDVLNEDEEETQLNKAEIYVPSSGEDDVLIVQTLRGEVCPPHKSIPKDDRAVAQKVAKNFEAGLFRGQVASIEEKKRTEPTSYNLRRRRQ
jgi:hypothetical protein